MSDEFNQLPGTEAERMEMWPQELVEAWLANKHDLGTAEEIFRKGWLAAKASSLSEWDGRNQLCDYADANPADPINHPRHYTWHPIAECEQIAGEFGYHVGVAMAYLWRHDHKGTPLADLRKAVRHIEMEIKRRERE